MNEKAESEARLRIHVVGDTQRVMPIEQLVLGRDTNDVGRSAVAREILGEPCDAIVHLGDLVGAVGSARDWARFDCDYPPSQLRDKRFFVCRGNHDCGGLFMGAPRQFELRYPESIGRLRVFDLSFVKLLLLDTNAAALSHEHWERQRTEFNELLRASDADSSVRHVLVFGHHPPFTNGHWHRPDLLVRATFVEPFLKCSKARAFFSGHVHGYERFSLGGRVFIVSGGGGGPRVSHLHGTRQRCVAVVNVPDPHPLHYVRLDISAGRIRSAALFRNDATGNWGELDSCEVVAV